MNTTIISPKPATHICHFCQQPANDSQGLVRESGYYAHPGCSNRDYELVSEVSFPDSEPDWDALYERTQAARDYLLVG